MPSKENLKALYDSLHQDNSVYVIAPILGSCRTIFYTMVARKSLKLH